jgi:pentatricopeptide repeat protein
VMQQSDLVPDVIPYRAAISACEKGEQWQQAFGLLAVMQQSVLVPGVIAYNAAISACEKSEQWQQALGVLAVMLQSGLIPNVIEHMGQEEQMRVINQPVSFLGELAAEAEDNVGEISDRSDADAARSSGGAGNVGEISDVPGPMDEGATRPP